MKLKEVIDYLCVSLRYTSGMGGEKDEKKKEKKGESFVL
jgi:hypothetical protein